MQKAIIGKKVGMTQLFDEKGKVVPVTVVASKSILSRSNIELERVKSKVEKQKGINESLEMQVNELASLSNIQDIAKTYGLSYNNDNIIVIK